MTGAATTRRPLDVICLGRAAVDLYGQQRGGRLEDVQSFAKSLGGSSANVAAGLARLGSRSSMLTRVGDEQMGRFVREALAAEGVDVSHVATDPRRLTGLVILGIGGADSFPHIFYRENCADMAIGPDDFDGDYIASGRVLAVTGTHLSTISSAAAVTKAIELARRHDTRIVLDVDYRPVLWGLTAAGDGENRFVASREATARLQSVLPACDLVVGTEEEIRIAGGSADTGRALENIGKLCTGTIVLKRGAAGCTVHPGKSTGSTTTIEVPGFPVEVLNTLGAGDAFLAGFLHAWLDGADWQRCGLTGNACGALVVSRHACTPAMPTAVELEEYLGRAQQPVRPDLDTRIAHLHSATTTRRPMNDLCILAFDHRSQLEELAAWYGRPFADIARFKALVATAFSDVASRRPDRNRLGVILDDRYGAGLLPRLTATAGWVGRAIEVPGSRPLEYEPRAHCGLVIRDWPARHVVKCLVRYHPEDPLELRLEQERRIVELFLDTTALERELLLEVVVPHEHAVGERTTANVLRRFYNLGVRPAWWKLATQSPASWPHVETVIGEYDPHCNGVVLLGLDAPEQELKTAFEAAAPHRLCRGFAVGRSIFGAAARDWFAGRMDDASAIADVAARYERLIGLWQAVRPMQDRAGFRRESARG